MKRRVFNFAAALALLAASSVTLAKPSATTARSTHEPPEHEATAVRLFELLASADPEMNAEICADPTLSGPDRNDILRLYDNYAAEVAKTAEGLAADMPWREVQRRASRLGKEFSKRELGPWLEQRPAVRDLMFERAAASSAAVIALRSEPERLLQAAKSAGLPIAQLDAARQTVAQAREELLKSDRNAEEQLRQTKDKPAGDAREMEEMTLSTSAQMRAQAIGRRTVNRLTELMPADVRLKLGREIRKSAMPGTRAAEVDKG